MKCNRSLLFVLIVLSFLLTASIAHAEGNLKGGGSSFVVAFDKVKAPKNLKSKLLTSFTKDFLKRDKRYTIVAKQDDKTTHTLAIKVAKKGRSYKFVMKGLMIAGGAEASFETTLKGRVSVARVEAEIARGIRTLFDFEPEKMKVMLRILGISEEGDADAGVVEDAIYSAIEVEYDQVVADYYTMPVKDKDVPYLAKGDKKRLKAIREKSGADLLITGTIKMPKTKNIGGATENLYKGKALVRIKVWDLKKHHQVTEVKLDLNGQGIFSELVFSLFDAAAKKSAEEIKQDLGFPETVEEPKQQEGEGEEGIPSAF